MSGYETFNTIKTLDVSKNTKLVFFSCSENCLTTLDISKNSNLLYFYCTYNELKSLYSLVDTWYESSYKIQFTDEKHNDTNVNLKITIKK